MGESMKLVPKVTLKEMLVNGSLRKPLIIAMMMMLAQQLSGINCAIFYSTSIFEKAGLDSAQSQSATLGMGAMNVAMTFVSRAYRESWTQSSDGFWTLSDAVHDHPSTRQPS